MEVGTLLIVGLFNIFIATLFNAHPVTFESNASHHLKMDDSMKQMLILIHNNYPHNISIEDLCAAGGVSRGQCFSLFKKYTGDTPSIFILKCRLAIARNQLSNTSIPISQITTDCGFTHQSHFTSHFSKYYGVTPNNYRRKNF